MKQTKESSLEESQSQVSGFVGQPADGALPPKASPGSAPMGVRKGGAKERSRQRIFRLCWASLFLQKVPERSG